MLDQISRALPQMLWLTELKQATGTDVVIDGKCTTLTGLSEFVSNLEASGYFKRSIEIIDTKTEMAGTPPSEIIRFSIKATFQQPGEAKPAAATKAGG
jgi:Tfp pilus assembly protein PilN